MLSINQFCHDCMSHFIIALAATKYVSRMSMAGCPIAMLTLQVPVLRWWQSWDPAGVHSAFQVLGGRALQQAPVPCELQRRFRERTPKGPLSQFNSFLVGLCFNHTLGFDSTLPMCRPDPYPGEHWIAACLAWCWPCQRLSWLIDGWCNHHETFVLTETCHWLTAC